MAWRRNNIETNSADTEEGVIDEITEHKKRSAIKAGSWRVIAIINSWVILVLKISDKSLVNAIAMNITGFFLFYFFDRIWAKISYGRDVKKTTGNR